MFEDIRLIAVDADDTLWDNEGLFRAAEKHWADSLSAYGDESTLSSKLYAVEERNMEDLGYGAKAFAISLLETTVELAGSELDCSHAVAILESVRSLLCNPAAPYPGVEGALGVMASLKNCPMVVFTKGDLLDQQTKVRRSGLGKYFDSIEIVPNKSVREYAELCSKWGTSPAHLLMIGNSFKSDIKPALDLGGWGIYIPGKATWVHEIIPEYDHHRLLKLKSFSEIPAALWPTDGRP